MIPTPSKQTRAEVHFTNNNSISRKEYQTNENLLQKDRFSRFIQQTDFQIINIKLSDNNSLTQNSNK